MDLQRFLEAQFDRQDQAHERLEFKIDKALEKLGEHETRLTVVENTRKSVRWLVGVVITAVAGWVVSLFTRN